MQDDTIPQGPLEALKFAQLFGSLDDAELQDLTKALTTRIIATGETLFRYGDSGDELFVIKSGIIELYVKDTTGDKISLTKLGPGELFGELSLLDGGPRSAYAEALEESVLFVLDRDHLSQFLNTHPGAAMELIAMLSQRLRSTDRLLMSRVSRNLNAEVEHELSLFQKLASWIAVFSGSMPFLVLNILFFAIWIGINLDMVPFIGPFDPYPFGFLTMAVSLEAIFLSIIVLLAQNLQSAKDKIRGDIEYEVNLKAELEISELHTKVDHIHTEILRAVRGISRPAGPIN